jgi:hypothetical protein
VTDVETPTVKVLMSPELMEQWASRDEHGRKLHWTWPPPDPDGFVTPVIRVDDSDKLVCLCESCRAWMVT